MIRNLFITALRNLKKNKFFSFLNIGGLAVGMAVFILIAHYVRFENSYEGFIPDGDNIYRVTLTGYLNNDQVLSSAENYPGVGPALKNELPEVISYARLYNMGYKNNLIITNEEAKPDPIAFKHRRFLYADSSFLPMMGYRMIKGDAAKALAEPFNAVISETYARLYFGNEDPIGKTLRLQDDDYNNELATVTGVFADLPHNTHLKFDVLFSYRTLFGRFEGAIQRYDQGWRRQDMYVFIKVRPGTDPRTLENKFPTLVDKYNPGLKEKGRRDVLALQPLKEIHLTSKLAEEPEPNGDARIVFFLGLIGIFVIVIAWINYVNLATARAMDRAKEVGVRKVMGAYKFQLVRQFMTEAAIVNFLSIVLAGGVAAVVLPYFNRLAGTALTIGNLVEPWFLLLAGGIWMAGTVLSGFYPALVLSSFKPVTVLKGKLKNTTSGILLRKSLVVMQFMASVALIAGTIIVYRQLDHMMKVDLGFDINQVLVVERPGISPRDRNAFSSAVDVFRNEVKTHPSVQAVTASVTIPGKQREYKVQVKKYGTSDDQLVTVRFNSMDFDYMDVFKMKLLAGRAFSPEFTKDPDTSVIITETASLLLGFKTADEAIGQTISSPNFGFHPIVAGVVNDYHQVSLKHALDPSVFYCSPHYGEFYSVRVKTSDLSQTLDHVKGAWDKAFPGNPFDYFFLDDYFNRQYENERKFGTLFTTFAILAMIVGCLGLFGLSAYTATQRTKEIGIRKALGSTEGGIFILLSKEYIKLVLLSVVLATPLVWYFMKDWIDSFPYRTSISVAVFVVAGAVVLIVSLLTVSIQTVKAARTNPVDSLRCE